MKALKYSEGYILKFSKDELLVNEILKFSKKNKIKFAWFDGLGAAQGVELGYYSINSQDYQWQTFTKLAEVTNLTGNVSILNNEHFVHAHITLTDEHFKAFGGHLKELVVGGTVEINLRLINKNINRVYEETTGLNVLDL